MTQEKNAKVKCPTVPRGKVCLILMYICAFVIAFTALVVLLAGNTVGFGILGVAILVFVPIIILMHFHNCGNTVTFIDDKIQSKRKTLTWDTAYLTVHSHGFWGSRAVFVWIYFDDYYLTEKEIRSWRVSRQGLCIRLDSTRAYFILSCCQNKIKFLNDCASEDSNAFYLLYSHNTDLKK